MDALRKHYDDWNGRPTKELYSMIGLMILQQMHDLTDDQAAEQFCFNIQWHYALNITNFSDAASYVSNKSLWTMREHLSTDEIYSEIFDSALKILEKSFKIDLSKQRMDSVHVKSNMRRLGRIGVFVRTIKKFLINLKRQHRGLFDQLDPMLTQRYLSKNQESLFAMVKPSESGKSLDQLAEDVFVLTRRFATMPLVQDMSSFKLLIRLFNEQCVVEDIQETAGPKAVARPNKDVPSDSLQNPSDPDAGYSGHKGQGYQVQVVENYSADEKKQLSLITYVAVESADNHDAGSLLPALDKLEEQGLSPRELLADSLYGSDANCEKALQEHDVTVVSPVMPGNQKKFHLADFTIDNQGRILACPKGVSPDNVKKTSKGQCAAFPVNVCLECQELKQCPISKGKKACYYRYKEKDVRIANRRQYENTPVFKDKYRYRAGVEATMSEFDRRTGVKHLRVRGMKAVKFAAFMKSIGLNIFRAARYRRRKGGTQAPHCSIILVFWAIWSFFKEQFKQRMRTIAALCSNSQPIDPIRLRMVF